MKSWWVGLSRDELNAAARTRQFKHVALDGMTCAEKEGYFARRARGAELNHRRAQVGFTPRGGVDNMGTVTLLRGGESSAREAHEKFEKVGD